MTPLELTISQQARNRLTDLRRVLAVPFENRADNEFTEAHSSLYALLELGHLAHSGITEETSQVLLSIEHEAAALLAGKCSLDPIGRAADSAAKTHPPRVQVVTQDLAELKHLYPEEVESIQANCQVQIQFAHNVASDPDFDSERYTAGLAYVAHGNLEAGGHEDETNAPYYFGHSVITAFEAGAAWQAQRNTERK